ncbi:MAG: hypothetical protein Q9212_003953 [Teloschistes hypoglaucus]
MDRTRSPSHLQPPSLPSFSILVDALREKLNFPRDESDRYHQDSIFVCDETDCIMIFKRYSAQDHGVVHNYGAIAIAMLRIRVVVALNNIMAGEHYPRMVRIRANDVEDEWNWLERHHDALYINTDLLGRLKGWRADICNYVHGYIESHDRAGLEDYISTLFHLCLQPQMTPSGETIYNTIPQLNQILNLETDYKSVRDASRADEDYIYKTFQSSEQDRGRRQPSTGHLSSQSLGDRYPSSSSLTLVQVPRREQSSRHAPHHIHGTEDYHPPPPTEPVHSYFPPPSMALNDSYARDPRLNIPYYPTPSLINHDPPSKPQLLPLNSNHPKFETFISIPISISAYIHSIHHLRSCSLYEGSPIDNFPISPNATHFELSPTAHLEEFGCRKPTPPESARERYHSS